MKIPTSYNGIMKYYHNAYGKFGLIFLTCLMACVGTSCDIQKLATRASISLLSDSFTAVNAENDLELAKAGATASLSLIEGILLRTPDSIDVRMIAAEAYIGYALAFVEHGSPLRAAEFFRRGRNHALHAWKIQAHKDGTPEPRSSLWFNLKELKKYLATLSHQYVPVVYWAAQGWAGLIQNESSNPELLADIPTIIELSAFILRHNPSYGFAGAHVLLGAIESGIPRFLGGSPESARNHFERAMTLTQGRFLMTQIVFASTYAVQVQDRPLFTRLLEEVRLADINLLPEQRLANAAAKRHAERLQEHIDELFER